MLNKNNKEHSKQMTENKAIRLSKVAKELNIGTSTIVDFLSSKGHAVESNPNSRLNTEQYQLLLKEFQSEKIVKEKSAKLNEKVPKQTISIEDKLKEEKFAVKEDVGEDVLVKEKTPVKKETPIKEEAPVVEMPTEETKTEPIAENAITEEVIKEETKTSPAPEINQSTPVIEETNTTSGIKVLGKIELPTPKKRVVVKEEPKKVVEASTKPAKEEPVVLKKEETKKEIAPEVKVEPVVETPKVEKTIAPVVKENTEVVETPKEEKPVNKEPELIRATAEKLGGPVVLGKIELPKETPRQSISKAHGEYVESQKKKRKRIEVKKVDTTKPATQPGAKPDQPRGSRFNNAAGGGGANRFNKNKKEPKVELTDEEIQKQIKETLAQLSERSKSRSVKLRRQKRDEIRERIEEEQAREEQEKKILKVTEFVSANELATMMDVSVTQIISACMSLGLFVSINQRLDAETISIIAEEFGFTVNFVSVDVVSAIEEIVDKEEDLTTRPPIVTVMGHVDHGKTSLLDHIRKANVIAGEAGGITQHIGAYTVKLDSGKQMTFIDTPGHEAFTAMRARGAQVTDIAIIVIAADDSVMPQTVEAINHAKAAGVPIVFAFNKIDKESANPDKIRETLAQMNFLVEEWGGTYQTQEVSAKKGLNMDILLDKVLLEAEMLNLKANPKRKAAGTVIEAQLDKGRGFVCTLLVQTGELKVGDAILAGPYSGRVKALYNEREQKINSAGPSTPVRVLGLTGAPQAGDKFNAMEDEREAREIAAKRLQLQREQGMRARKHITLDEIGRRIAIGDFQQLNIIIKGDTDGSIEALTDSLLKLSTEKIQVNVIHKSVGAISESDVLLASASDAIIVGFQVRPSLSARKLAEKEEIDIRHYSVIYQAIDEITAAMEGMLAPEFEEKIMGNIEIREVFNITKVGTIAGAYVIDGKVSRQMKIRVIRDGIVIHTGKLASLKRFKDDVKEVTHGYECGLQIDRFNDIQVNDLLEAFEEVEVKAKL